MTLARTTRGFRLGVIARQGGRKAEGFTLVELMIVLAIIAIVMTMSVPMIWKAMAKDDLARAVNDVMEGCKLARDRAIISGTPHEFVISAKGDMTIGAAASGRQESVPLGATGSAQPTGSLMAGFPRHLGEDVIIQLIGVNNIELMDAPDAHVRFFPNGTSDAFTVVFAWKGAQRTVTLDMVTGLPEELTK
jgi:type II secretion system protein H